MFILRILFAAAVIGLGAAFSTSGILSLLTPGSSTLFISGFVGFIAFTLSSMTIGGAVRRKARGQGTTGVSGFHDDDGRSMMRSQNGNISFSQGDVVSGSAGLPPGSI